MSKKLFVPLFLVILLISVNAQPKNNITALKREVAAYYDSGKIEKELDRVVDAAIKKIDKIKTTKNSAVVFDIDETILSNYSHMKEIDFGYVPVLWNKWILESRATVIKPVKRLYDYLVKKNIKIVFLTGRYTDQYEATVSNLKSQDVKIYDTVIAKNKAQYHGVTASKYKEEKRLELVKKGYEIIACVGDQWSDMDGKNVGLKIKLPNYIYIID